MSIGAELRFDTVARIGVGLLLVLGCWQVLQPFLPAILFSAAIVVSTWPAHRWLLHRLRGRANVAAVLSCLVVALLVVVPTVVLVVSLGDGAAWLLKVLEDWRESGPHALPQWLAHVPVLGQALQRWLRDALDGGGSASAQLAEPARRLALAGGRALGNGVAQTLLAVLLLFFFYRDGARLARRMQHAAQWLGGPRGSAMLDTANRTVVGVMVSVIGTALAQSAVAILGFAIAGVPRPLLLGAVTFVLSMAPVGPPLIWGGATLWLLRQGDTGWAVFMALYGLFGISSVDNLIKPFLISRSSHLPFALTFMGVIGGVLAFGVAGVFIGPTLLALAISLARQTLLADPPRA